MHAQMLVQIAQARQVIEVIGAVLPLWPLADRSRPKVSKTDQAASKLAKPRIPATAKHNWHFNGTHWKCWTCRSRTIGDSLPKSRQAWRCGGLPDRLAMSADYKLGIG